LEGVKALTPTVVDDGVWREVPAFLYGIELYAHGYFWEAHEVWEPVWLATAPSSRERHLMAGLIQLANACLKLEMRRPRAAVRLLQASADELAECRPDAAHPLMGMGIRALGEALHNFSILVREHVGDGQGLIEARPALATSPAASTAAD
jgi:hypothetical protein